MKKVKIKCKGCHRPILVKTARKYQGFSRQCLKKFTCIEKSEVIPDKILPSIKDQIKTRLTAVLPQEKPSYEYHLGIMSQVNYLRVKSVSEA